MPSGSKVGAASTTKSSSSRGPLSRQSIASAGAGGSGSGALALRYGRTQRSRARSAPVRLCAMRPPSVARIGAGSCLCSARAIGALVRVSVRVRVKVRVSG